MTLVKVGADGGMDHQVSPRWKNEEESDERGERMGRRACMAYSLKSLGHLIIPLLLPCIDFHE